MDLASRDIFAQGGAGNARGDEADEPCPGAELEGPSATGEAAHMRAFEIAGRKCYDLLARSRAELKLLEGDDGRTNVVGAVEAQAQTSEDCCRIFREALAR